MNLDLPIQKLQYEVERRIRDIPRIQYWIKKGSMALEDLEKHLEEMAQFKYAIKLMRLEG